jgi:hypothetical protein
MSNIRFKMRPQLFIYMGLFAPSGLFLVYRGMLLGNNQALIFGGVFLAVSFAFFLAQLKKIYKVSPEVEKELDKLFPPNLKRKALILLEDSFTGYQEASVHQEILKASRGDMNRLKKIARVLRRESDFREAYPAIEKIEKDLDRNTN